MVVFDLDDTLYKEIDYVSSGYRAIGRELEREGIMPGIVAVDTLESAPTMAEAFDRLAGMISLDSDGRFSSKWMVDIYRYHIPDVLLTPDVSCTLRKLKARNVRMGIITDGRSATQRAKLKALGMYGFVDEDNIIISEEIGADKCSDVPFKTIVDRNPNETSFMYIGDNPAKDFFWPNSLGWHTVELLDIAGVNIHPQALPDDKRYHPDCFISSIHEILFCECL